MRVTAIRSDHSAADSFMYLIKAGDVSILHTGDFRLHRRFRGALLESIKQMGDIDVLITEGTTLSRVEGENYTESHVKELIQECIDDNKYCFFLLSSANFDRLQLISDCVPVGKYFLMDEFQKELCQIAEKSAHDRYEFNKKTCYGKNLDKKIKQHGFAMIVRANAKYAQIMQNYMKDFSKQSCFVYSMWSGYMESTQIKELLDIAGNRLRIIHSSGHVTRQDLEEFVRLIDAKKVIVIHTESEGISVSKRQIIINDGEPIVIQKGEGDMP